MWGYLPTLSPLSTFTRHNGTRLQVYTRAELVTGSGFSRTYGRGLAILHVGWAQSFSTDPQPLSFLGVSKPSQHIHPLWNGKPVVGCRRSHKTKSRTGPHPVSCRGEHESWRGVMCFITSFFFFFFSVIGSFYFLFVFLKNNSNNFHLITKYYVSPLHHLRTAKKSLSFSLPSPPSFLFSLPSFFFPPCSRPGACELPELARGDSEHEREMSLSRGWFFQHSSELLMGNLSCFEISKNSLPLTAGKRSSASQWPSGDDKL